MLVDRAEGRTPGWTETETDRWRLQSKPRRITAWLALEKIIVRAKADAAVRLKPKPLACAIQSQREIDIRFLPWNARPSLAPGLLGHLGDPVIERPRAVRFLLCRDCGIGAPIAGWQYGHAEVWQEQRSLSEIVHFESESIFTITHRDQRSIKGIWIRIGDSLQLNLKTQGGDSLDLFDLAVESFRLNWGRLRLLPFQACETPRSR